MNIGVYVTEQSATEGGSFTYETMLIDELLHQHSNHHYYIFHHNYPFNEKDVRKNVTFVNINDFQKEYKKKDVSFVKTIFSRIVRKILLTANILSPVVFSEHDTKNILNFLAQKFRIDLFWFMTPQVYAMEIPYIMTIWDLQHLRQPYFPEVSNFVSLVREENFRYMLPKATYVITGVEAGKKELQLFYNLHEDRIKLLRHPTPFRQSKTDTDYTASFNKLGIQKPFIFYPAQFWAHKNHIVILLALSILKKENNIEVQAVFTGSDKGNLEFIKENAQKLGVDKQIIYPGFVSSDVLAALYSNAEMLVYPTFFGPENLPPLEAMALGCPAIVSDVDGAKEQYGDSVLYFETCNETELAEKILLVLNDKSVKEKLTANGKKRASEWTASHYIQEMEKIFTEFSLISRTWQ